MEGWENDMEHSMWAGVRAIVLAITALLLLPLQAQAERDWEFSVGAFGGKAFHSNEDFKFNSGDTGFPVHGTVHGVTLNDSGTFGGKLTAWYLPRKYNWQPQVGLELDFTRFTADLHPQLRGADGTWPEPGFQLGSVGFSFVRDLSVNTLAANLLFRYPIWSTPDLPGGRIAPYVGFGVGAQRAVVSLQVTPYREVDYAPAGQALVGMKFFLMRNLAVFGEYKRIWSSHTFTYSGTFAPGYEETWSVVTNVLVGGVSVHF
jgi:Outer membrane protein beta-barrel domain